MATEQEKQAEKERVTRISGFRVGAHDDGSDQAVGDRNRDRNVGALEDEQFAARILDVALRHLDQVRPWLGQTMRWLLGPVRAGRPNAQRLN